MSQRSNTHAGEGSREGGPLAEPEVQIAAAALAAAVSPPLGVAVAAGSALRSPRVRAALRRGTVQALAGAMQLGEQLRAGGQEAAPAPERNGNVTPIVPLGDDRGGPRGESA